MDRKGIPEMSDSTLDGHPQTAHGNPEASLAGTPSRYRQDHTNPVNHFLHVGVGWPMAAVAVILLPFRPLWGLGLFVLAYAIMFFGHFVFERNIPTIFKEPSTPFVVAFAVIRRLLGAARIMISGEPAVHSPRRSRPEN
jgi:hypothetical protein